MAGYTIVPLGDLMEQFGGDKAKLILSSFLCPLNPDVEYFLRSKAIVFEEQGISKTHLVYASYQKKHVLVGYFSLANKYIVVTASTRISATLRKRLSRFMPRDVSTGGYTLSAPLIGQLGKNFEQGYNSLITGDELLHLACETVREAQRLIGGKIVYLECEDKPRLIEFYSRNGFVEFDKREFEVSERTLHSGTYLVQMLKYF